MLFSQIGSFAIRMVGWGVLKNRAKERNWQLFRPWCNLYCTLSDTSWLSVVAFTMADAASHDIALCTVMLSGGRLQVCNNPDPVT